MPMWGSYSVRYCICKVKRNMAWISLFIIILQQISADGNKHYNFMNIFPYWTVKFSHKYQYCCFFSQQNYAVDECCQNYS